MECGGSNKELTSPPGLLVTAGGRRPAGVRCWKEGVDFAERVPGRGITSCNAARKEPGSKSAPSLPVSIFCRAPWPGPTRSHGPRGLCVRLRASLLRHRAGWEGCGRLRRASRHTCQAPRSFHHLMVCPGSLSTSRSSAHVNTSLVPGPPLPSQHCH